MGKEKSYWTIFVGDERGKSEGVGEVKVKESAWIRGVEGAVVDALASKKHGLQTPVRAGLYCSGWLSRWARGCSVVLLCGLGLYRTQMNANPAKNTTHPARVQSTVGRHRHSPFLLVSLFFFFNFLLFFGRQIF